MRGEIGCGVEGDDRVLTHKQIFDRLSFFVFFFFSFFKFFGRVQEMVRVRLGWEERGF